MWIMINTRMIGLGEYRISTKENDVINARYITADLGAQIGSGRATGDTSNGFPGDYRVQYFNAAGELTGDLDLRITAVADSYRLIWRHRRENVSLPVAVGEIVFEGIGFATSDTSMSLTYWMAEKVSSAIEYYPLL